jgi:hypothetical protein
MVIMINFCFCYTWLYFASLVFTGWLVTTQWVHGHPTCIYFVKHCTVQCTLYSVLYTALYTEHSIASCQSASLQFLVSWRTLPPPSCFLYTISNTTQCSLLNHIQYPVLYTRFTLYCTLHFTLFSSLSFTPQSILNPKLLADMT